jgi:CRISPR-associated protein Csb2
MTRCLTISVRLYEARYHGAGEWPPAPARLFQALIAGAGLSGPLESVDRQALAWIEKLDPPVIAAPRKHDGHTVTLYVPNNDLDSVGGDPSRIAEIRGSQKVFKPRLFDDANPFKYVWTFEEDEDSARHAPVICALAERIYQFGRGVDFACAWGEVLDGAKLEEELLAYTGTIHRPSFRGSGGLKCPAPGSLKSLEDRYRESGRRFHAEQRGRITTQVFTKSPMPQFASIVFDSPARRWVFDLREISGDSSFAVWPISGTTRLVELLRDGAVARLCSALPSKRAEIDRVLVGRKMDGSENKPASERVRILPLPSIGHYHADRKIRRVVIEVPSGSPLSADDVQWAFSGLELGDPRTEEVLGIMITPAVDEIGGGMLAHYGFGDHEGHRRWRTVTPAALPGSAARRRIDPERRRGEVKGGQERALECAQAGGAVVQALRHAGVRARAEAIRVPREPFESNGERVEPFEEGTRFSKHRLWHVEIEFTDKVPGPLVIGDGRFLGLGIMAAVPSPIVNTRLEIESDA